MRLRYSAHAEEKVRTRKLSRVQIRLVLEKPGRKFYDVASNANIALKEVGLLGGRVGLVVVFTVSREGTSVVTVYPVKNIHGEIRRKVNSGRWIVLRG